MDQKGVKRVVGKRTVSPVQAVIQLNEFLKKNNLVNSEPKNERIRRVVGPSRKK